MIIQYVENTAAFDPEGYTYEHARILGNIAYHIESGRISGDIFDSDDNQIGHWHRAIPKEKS